MKHTLEAVVVDTETAEKRTLHLLPGTIPGIEVLHHVLPRGNLEVFPKSDTYVRVFFLIRGSARFSTPSSTERFAEMAYFAAGPKEETEVETTAGGGLHLLEIRSDMVRDGRRDGAPEGKVIRASGRYREAVQYRDYFKSEKTISRQIIGPHLFSGFSMGSVESRGFDRSSLTRIP